MHACVIVFVTPRGREPLARTTIFEDCTDSFEQIRSSLSCASYYRPDGHIFGGVRVSFIPSVHRGVGEKELLDVIFRMTNVPCCGNHRLSKYRQRANVRMYESPSCYTS